MVASWRLNATEWTNDLLRLQGLFILATYLGMLIGRSQFPNWLALSFSTLYAIFFIPGQLGQTMLEELAWPERLTSLWGRMLFSANQLINGENVDDPILFLTLMAVLIWVLGSHAGFMLKRHGAAWRAGIPIGFLIVVIQTYDSFFIRRGWYLAFYMAILLLLVARMYLLEQRQVWRARGTQTPTFIGTDMLRATGLAVLVLVVMAWVTPSLVATGNPARAAWDAITSPWREFRNEFGRAFYSLEGAPVKINDYYGESLLLGRGNSLASTIVMTVEVLPDSATPPRFYWRDRVYESYADGGWQSGHEASSRVEAENNELLLQAYESREVGTVQITSGRNVLLLHTPTQPISVSRNADIEYSPNPNGTWDISSLAVPVVLRSGESYQAEGYFTNANVLQLQAAGTDYPDWVLERYLQMPPEISTRTLELAAEIAQDFDNPFDIAAAITRWLRENINYVDSVESIPEGFEPIDWILFEQQEAFCNYYATAEIMMLRSLGIPARLAVGYAQGELAEGNVLLGGTDTEKVDLLGDIVQSSRYFTVKQKDAHAWPEVYFPGYGWVEFEPTVNQIPLNRPLGTAIEDIPEGNVNVPEETFEEDLDSQVDASVLEERLLAEEAQRQNDEMRLQLLWLSALAGILVVRVMWQRHRGRGGRSIPVLIERGMQRLDLGTPAGLQRWNNYSQLEPLPKAFMEINNALRRIGNPPDEGDTPLERAEALSSRIPRLKELIESLYGRYERALYKEGEENSEGADQARWTIRLASWVESTRILLGKWKRKPIDWRERLGKKQDQTG
jgi:transglutaminase-like putative cysteine protease